MNEIKFLFQNYAQKLYGALEADENLILQLKGEDSLFLRWNRGKVRQSTQIRQIEVSWTFQKDGRQLEVDEQLTLNLDQDVQKAIARIARLRAQALALEKSHQMAPLVAAEEFISIGETPSRDPAKIARQVEKLAEGLDLIGFWSSGPMVRAVSHSKGHFLFESRDSFFFDYSIFTTNVAGENKAVKGFFSQSIWNEDSWAEGWGQQLQKLKVDLARLREPSHSLAPGKYRVYLAPSAMASIFETMKSGGFSYAAYKHGHSALKEWIDGREKFSPKLSVSEDFGLGFSPRFNRFGELSPLKVPLIDQGAFANCLISGKSAREFGVISNGGEDAHWETETPRSFDVAAGDMPTKDALTRLGTGVWINEVHYTNFSDLKTARVTGMTRYACFWVENGEIKAPIQDLRFDVSLYELLGVNLLALTQERQDLLETGTYHLRRWAGSRLPGVLAENFGFTL